jgi:hypothetical protein
MSAEHDLLATDHQDSLFDAFQRYRSDISSHNPQRYYAKNLLDSKRKIDNAPSPHVLTDCCDSAFPLTLNVMSRIQLPLTLRQLTLTTMPVSRICITLSVMAWNL